MSLPKTDLLLLFLFITIFILIRSVNFSSSLNFSSDQAEFSIKAYKIFTQGEQTLSGPPTSIEFEGRKIFQGSIIYYFLLLFLLAGNFDPVRSSYIFMLFCSLMIIPLFIGTKLLINKNVAWFMVILYSLLPYFIDYTKFLWNPNFQFALSPLLILLMGYYKKNKSSISLFLLGASLGLLLQFHYQFVLIITALFIYYYFAVKLRKQFVFLFLGVTAGFSPILLFEIRNNFCNLNTLILFVNNINSTASNHQDFQNYPHYILVLSFFAFIPLAFILRNWFTKTRLSLIFFFLLAVSLLRYLPEPSSGFRMANNWNYLNEDKSFEIIKSQNLKNYNVTNLIYDTKANVQKYLIIKNNISIDPEDYYYNNYLFVLAPNDKNIWLDQAFEIGNFRPFEIKKIWPITNIHSLYLLERK